MSIDEQHVAFPKLRGAPAYARPPAPVQATPRPIDPDELPLLAEQTPEERALMEALLSRNGQAWLGRTPGAPPTPAAPLTLAAPPASASIAATQAVIRPVGTTPGAYVPPLASSPDGESMGSSRPLGPESSPAGRPFTIGGVLQRLRGR